jgi:hypothetical protein
MSGNEAIPRKRDAKDWLYFYNSCKMVALLPANAEEHAVPPVIHNHEIQIVRLLLVERRFARCRLQKPA